MNALRKKRHSSKSFGLVILIIGLALMVGSPLWSQGVEASERALFVSELLELLLEEGKWTADDVRLLAAQEVDWALAEGADPEVVALGLLYAKNDDEEMGPMEQALLAIELAQAAIEMEALGIGEVTIALTALEGVRDILTDIKAFRSGDLTGKELGETIRTKMHERVSVAAREHAQEHMHDRALEAQANRPDGLVPDIPAFSDSGFNPWW